MKFAVSLRIPVFSAAAILVVAAAVAQDSLAVQERHLIFCNSSGILAEPLYANPAVKPLSIPVSAGIAGAGYIHRHGSSMALDYDPDMGEVLWELQSKAAIRSGNNTVWGHAAYDNGRHLGRRLCLGSDYEMIYPYVNATLTGGDMRQEHYRFGGGWGARISPRWHIGASLCYDAGHAYRNIDPRPRNVTGDLRIGTGTAFRPDSCHLIGLDLTLQRYTQSNSTTFVSDMGHEIIYHLTGLATQYQRFAGLGPTMNYTAYEPGAGLQFMRVDGFGFFASARFAHMHMRCLLTALNRLPMAAIDQNRYEIQAGWLGNRGLSDFGVAIGYEGRRRDGDEGIFGDPVSSVYPKIGSQRMYTDTRDQVEVSFLWRHGRAGRRVTVRPAAALLHRQESYDHNVRLLKADRWRVGAQVQGDAIFGKIFSSLIFKADFYLPSSRELRLPVNGSSAGSAAAITDAMLEIQRTAFRAVSEALQTLSAQWNVGLAMTSRYAIGADVQWEYAHSAAGNNFNRLTANINFYF